MSTVYLEEMELHVEEIQEVLAPGDGLSYALTHNHNKTFVADLEVEELESVIAPALSSNHNETLIGDRQ